jgi:hypothetical protein
MKLLFSEYDPDYSRYLYPYVIWAVPGPGDRPGDLYAAGFHPASPGLDRFTLCRQLRVPLPGWSAPSENRRILRKGGGIVAERVSKLAYPYNDEVRARWLAFAEDRFGAGVMSRERLDGLMSGPVVTDILVFRDIAGGGREVGAALMYVEAPRMAHYYYAFYDRTHANRSLGLYLMTAAVQLFQGAGFGHLYIGTCYSERALYKAQFRGLEFFNGLGWSTDVEELKFLVRRDARERHLLQEPGFLEPRGGLPGVVAWGGFEVGPGWKPGESIAGASGVPA